MVSIRKLKKEIKKLNVHINYSADILRRISRIDPFAPDALEAYYIAKKRIKVNKTTRITFTRSSIQRGAITLSKKIFERKKHKCNLCK